MIDPPRVLSEEPTAVTPHGGICGGESQQWLSYPTKPHAGICAGGQGAIPVPTATVRIVTFQGAVSHALPRGPRD